MAGAPLRLWSESFVRICVSLTAPLLLLDRRGVCLHTFRCLVWSLTLCLLTRDILSASIPPDCVMSLYPFKIVT